MEFDVRRLAAALMLCAATNAVSIPGRADDHAVRPDDHAGDHAGRADEPDSRFQEEAVSSDGAIQEGGVHIAYGAVAGTLTVHPKDWDDVKPLPSDHHDDGGSDAEASMFYVAYFRKGAPEPGRPLTFVYNGGPGSSSVWLHMGAFGPRRVVTNDDTHTPGAPYKLIDNAYSLLDATDLVFVDAPGTGFGRIGGRDKEKAFWGVDQDGWAFTDFITRFLSRYDRWNSPRYLFGESYGTTRSAVVASMLENRKDLDLNGVILLSQVLNFELGPDGPEEDPGNDMPYVLALPTYAATAWYHHRLPGDHPDLTAFLAGVEQFATGEYRAALEAGATLDPASRDRIVATLHADTGLPEDYIRRADLRIDGGEFEQTLLGPDETTGRLDSRFAGPTMDPLAKEADYDPQSSAISSAYVSTFNDYVRHTLHFGAGREYRAELDLDHLWDFQHQPPGADQKLSIATNVMPDLANALITDPDLKVQLNAGFFDVATPFYQGIYEMQHLRMPRRLQANIEFHQYRSGHMVYAHEESLKALHDNVADFIRRTSQPGRP